MQISGNDSQQFTSRIQKGGALLQDMRKLVSIWNEDKESHDPLPEIARTLGKATLARARDTYSRAFRPRFLNGNPAQAWKLARVLEDHKAGVEIVRPLYYWITARAEMPLYEYATKELCRLAQLNSREITASSVVEWMRSYLSHSGRRWTPTVQLKVARTMLAALRDFNILEGIIKKRIALPHLELRAFAFIAFCLHSLGCSGHSLLDHTDWQLFLLTERDVERLFLETHQAGWLSYQAAGRIIRIDFPCDSFGEYAHVVLS